MKKFLIIIILILPIIFLLSCTGSKLKTDLTEKNIKGKVKKITEREYYAVEKFGNVEKDSLKDTLVYKYDEKGYSLFSKVDFFKSKDPNDIFNEKEHTSQHNRYNNDGSVKMKIIFKWDDNFNMIENSEYRKDGSLSRKQTYKYDDKGKKIEANTIIANNYFGSEHRTYIKYIYKYDNRGNLTGWFSEDGPNNILSPIEIYKYDGKGNKTEENHYSDGSVSEITKNIYDNKGNLTEVNLNSDDGSSSAKTIYKYDDKGNKVEETSSGTLFNEPIKWNFTYKYEYDKIGNWIKMINSKDGVLGSITEREIEYY